MTCCVCVCVFLSLPVSRLHVVHWDVNSQFLVFDLVYCKLGSFWQHFYETFKMKPQRNAIWNGVYLLFLLRKIPIRQRSLRFCIFSFVFRVVDSLSGPVTIHCDLINSIEYVVFIDYKHLLCAVENMNGFASSPSTYLNVRSSVWEFVSVCMFESASACGKCYDDTASDIAGASE